MFLFVLSASMASTSKSAILGGTTTVVEYVVVDVAHKGESVVEAFNVAKAGLEASSSVAVSVVLALQVNGWNQDAKAGLEELVKEQVLVISHQAEARSYY